LLGEHEEESSQKITKLEALCKRLREDAKRLNEEKATLEGMVKSRDELITKIFKEIGLDCIGEDAEEDGDNEDNNEGGDTAAPPAAAPPLDPAPPAAVAPEEVIMEEDPIEMVPE
jgi:peptidoglycan hydrolase CwlO-like protein